MLFVVTVTDDGANVAVIDNGLLFLLSHFLLLLLLSLVVVLTLWKLLLD